MKRNRMLFRAYRDIDRQACLLIFDANCPEFFAPNEREDYENFLESTPTGYEVCEVDGRIVGAFGLFDESTDKSLNWILLDPETHGLGIGRTIMDQVIRTARNSNVRQIHIAASQKSSPFFARFGATITSTISDGWGPGMHRLDMVLLL